MKYPVGGLPSWRNVIEPNPDVAMGRYKQAEFAADLNQVARGTAETEYQDPKEFFDRTYITEGMSSLMATAIERLSGRGGEPVIQLKTAFGGGKTHSMLALYHMLGGKVSLQTVPVLQKVTDRAGVAALPKANIAVIVGTALDPNKTRRPNNMPGITIHTVWGEIAAQLADATGNPGLFELVRESDKNHVSPGSNVFTELFDTAGSCLILMDELVAYARKLVGANDLPAGTFENFLTFIQEITEGARASKNSLIVASIPESEHETGGEYGEKALAAIEHTFGRMEAIWKPVAANEGFEIVRRRLFKSCKDKEARELVCQRFSQLYQDNPGDFPIETKEVDYYDQLLACYPIHPEIFEKLYEEWSTLEDFQRTRGVLRLMALVIHELWMSNDSSPMIMPGSIPFDIPAVRDELLRYLPNNDVWNPIVTSEIDGKTSIPYQIDTGNPRYGQKLAARRVTRTIMLGSAPTSRSQAVRGVEASRIRLGVVQPGENISDFNDALNTLKSRLSYLYTSTNGDRCWFDNRPTLRKKMQDRMSQFDSDDADQEIVARLRHLRREKPFDGVHICPKDSSEIPDDQCVRLVVLKPSEAYSKDSGKDMAIAAALNDLNTRGGSPRIYKNMLIFLAADAGRLNDARIGVKEYLAWKSISNDWESLNLDATQQKETRNSLQRADDTVESRIKELYTILLVPSIDLSVDISTIQWAVNNLGGGQESIMSKVCRKVTQDESVISLIAPAILKMHLDNLLWKDRNEIKVKDLWGQLSTYCYLPRLANFDVLQNAICSGTDSKDYFALAGGIEGNKYLGLKYNTIVSDVNSTDYIVKLEPALKQIAEESVKPVKRGGETPPVIPPIGPEPPVPPIKPVTPENNNPKSFFLSYDLDNSRLVGNFSKIVEEVISNLSDVDGTHLKVSIEVAADNDKGFKPDVVRTVTENCVTLKIKDSGFNK